MTLAGQQHHVTGAGGLEGCRDRLAAVRDEQQVMPAPPAGRLRATGDLVEDRLAILAARVLVGHDHQACALTGDTAHLRALGRVPLAGRAEHRDDPSAPGRGRRREEVEDGGQRRRAVGEVHDHAEGLPQIDALHPAGHEIQPGQALADPCAIEAERLPERDHCQRVVDVEAAAQAEVDGGLADRANHLSVDAARILGDAAGSDVRRRVGAVGHDPRARVAGGAHEQAG